MRLRHWIWGLLPLCVGSCGVGQQNHPAGWAISSQENAIQVCAGSTVVHGIDVSEWQGQINWTQASSGLSFAIARINDGTHMDPYFSANWQAMKQNGLIRGAYQFFEPGDDPTTQANIVINAVGTLGPGDLPAMLDVEWNNSGTPTVSEIQTWVNAVAAGTGKTPMVYTAAGYWNSYFSTQFGDLPLVVANYDVSCPTLPSSWSQWNFWQYSSTGSISGISGNVDLDEFNGSEQDLQTFAGLNECGSLADGFYCGGHGIDGDANTLFQCAGGQRTAFEVCASWCASTPGGDFCAPHRRDLPMATVDIDGDGKADVCGRDSQGIACYLSSNSFATQVRGPALSDAEGWASPTYYTSIELGDVNGDGKADVCARSAHGIDCWLSNGTGFPTEISTTQLADSSGWAAAEYRSTIQFADINGDGKLDLCARAAAHFSCWLFDGSSFTTEVDAPDMGDAQGWNAAEYYSTIQMGDVNGDGKADLCGRGWSGFECWLSQGSSFTANHSAAVADFSETAGGNDITWYSTLQMADVNGDGKLDVCGRTSAGFFCYLADGSGGFPTKINGPPLSDANGWNLPQYFTTIQMADVNGDGKADVCGRGNAGISCWLSNGSGFPTQISGPALSDASDWDQSRYDTTIQLADINGDGKADICGRASAGWMCWLSTGNGFSSTAINGPAWSDTAGWDKPEYVSTIQMVGPTGLTARSSNSSSTSSSSSTSGSSGTSSSTGSSGTHGTSSSSSTGGSTGSHESSIGSTGGTGNTSELTVGSTSGSTSSGAKQVKGGCNCSAGGETFSAWALLLGLITRAKLRRRDQPR
jgi:GH25 family lysozyme M1 (1,4-beta-N-acetylmuramidase)